MPESILSTERLHMLEQDIAALYERNASEGYSALVDGHYCYIKPSPRKYPFQWYWDTCFHVLVLCALGQTEVAQRNMRSLFLPQGDDGFVGHMIFWKRTFPTHVWDILQAHPTWRQLRPHMSALLQPSFAAQALERLHACTDDAVFLQELLPRVEAYLDYVWRMRRFDETGLLSIVSPVESGMDYKPSFDRALGCRTLVAGPHLYRRATLADLRNFLRGHTIERLRTARNGFRVQETTFNTAFALDCFAMARLQRTAGDTEAAAQWEERALHLEQAILTHLYDENTAAFYDRDDHGQIPVLCASTFFPLALPHCPTATVHTVLERHFDDPQAFGTRYLVPTVALHEPAFDARASWYLWRGPTWMQPNWLIHHMLCQRGERDRAQRLLQASLHLVRENGFCEYYHPQTGEGGGETDFTWGGLVLDMQREYSEAFPGK